MSKDNGNVEVVEESNDHSEYEQKIVDTEKTDGLSTTESKNNSDGEVVNVVVSTTPKDVDIAMKFAESATGMEIDKATDRRLTRKIDWIVLSTLSIVSAFQYMDKSSSSYSSVMGIRKDLKMVGDQYSWVGSSFYLAFLIFEIPTSLSLQKFPLAKVTTAYLLTWGVVLCLTSLVHTYAAFITCRVILGILESSITPAFVLFMSQWYKREEQFFRTCILIGWNAVGSFVGAPICYALYKRELGGTLSMTAWRIMFIIVGLITIVTGIVFFILIPDTPSQAWWLCKRDKLLVVERIRSNKQGYGNRKIKMGQIREAIRDPRLYLYFLLQFAVAVPNGGLGNFSSIMISNLGYGKGKAPIMGLPCSAVSVGGMCLFGYASTFIGRRLDIAMIGMIVNLISGCLIAFPKSKHAQVAGYYINGISPIPYVCILSMISSNSAGHSKKVFMGAINMIGYCVGNLVGPQTFRESQAPGYEGAKVAFVVCYCVALGILGLILVINVRENRRRDRLNETLPDTIANVEFSDLTDFQNPEFRYVI